MFIAYCKVIKKEIDMNNNFEITYQPEGSASTYILNQDNADNYYMYKLHEGSQFITLTYNPLKDSTKDNPELTGISFTGEAFAHVKSIKHDNRPSQRNQRLLNIANDMKLSLASVSHFSTFYSDNLKSFHFFFINWLISVLSTIAIFGSSYNTSSLTMPTLLLIMTGLSIITTQLRIQRNKSLLRRAASRLSQNKTIARFLPVLSKDKQITKEDEAQINTYIKTHVKNPTDAIELQHQFFDGPITKKQIIKELNKLR